MSESGRTGRGEDSEKPSMTGKPAGQLASWRKDTTSEEEMEGTAPRRSPVVAFVGHSGSGKTTLLLKVIPALKAHGMSVAVIKHSSHRGIETDVPGSDTRRLWDAGASEVALVAPDRIALSRRLAVEPPLGEVLDLVATSASIGGPAPAEGGAPVLVLIEGYKRSAVPKVEVIRAACNPAPLRDLAGRVACVTDVRGLRLGCPVFDLDDVSGLVEFLVPYALLRS